MIQKLLPVIVIAVAAAAGGGGGFFLKQAAGAKTADAAAGGEDAHQVAADEKESDHAEASKKKKSGGHGKKSSGHGDEDKGATSFMKFSRQFVVPVVKQGRPKSMVILDINIEIDDSLEESVYTLEPRLRDALLARLLALSGQGMLPQFLEDDEKLEATKAALLETSREIIGDSAVDVLILDLGIQSY